MRKAGTAALGLIALVVVAVLVWQGVTQGGVPDPGAGGIGQGTAVLNSAILVLREGLEAILVLAALTASMMGANGAYRRPVAIGAGAALVASVVTWFIAVAVIDAVDAPALNVQAATGLLAIAVLLVVMNWFFHSVYWTGWIAHHNKRRQRVLAEAQTGGSGAFWGLFLLGFTAMYREGFEVVLFLQNLRLTAGEAVVLQGVLLGGALAAGVGVLTFVAHHKLPYKRMLVLTGIMLGFVLVVMVGESVQEMQLAGWIPTTALPLPLPGWMGVWFAAFPNAEGLVAQAAAAVAVIGSYVVAENVRVRRPLRRGEVAAHRPEHAPGANRTPALDGR